MAKIKVMFPRVEAGFGHIMTCNAVEEIFSKKYGSKVEVININFYYKKKDEILTAHNQKIPKRKEQQQIITFDDNVKADNNNSTNMNDKAKKNGK